MFGPVITTEAHLAFSGARTRSNKTPEMTAMIETLSFLGPGGPVARDANLCVYHDSKHAAGLCLGTIQARTHVQLALACQQSMLSVQHRLRLTMKHVYGYTGNHKNNVPIMPPHLGLSALCQIITLLHVRFGITLIPLLVLVLATTLETSWKNCGNIRSETTSLLHDGS